jgi:hypothetical protein
LYRYTAVGGGVGAVGPKGYDSRVDSDRTCQAAGAAMTRRLGGSSGGGGRGGAGAGRFGSGGGQISKADVLRNKEISNARAAAGGTAGLYKLNPVYPQLESARLFPTLEPVK